MNAWEKVKRFFAGFLAGIVGLGAIFAAFWIGRGKGNNQSPKPDDRQINDSLGKQGQAIDSQRSAIEQSIGIIGSNVDRERDNQVRTDDTAKLLAESAIIRARARKFLEGQGN